jgi:threonylcarbamoyladenosine tRNA methylthiotransferase MtaB
VDRCRLMQESLGLPAFTTDIIVGFPGETDADFAETLRVAREIGFSKIHKFPFSARRGTPAAAMTDQVDPHVKSERLEQLAALEVELRDHYYESLRGKELRVLIESPVENRPGFMVGTACRYAPVELSGDVSMRKQFTTVTAGEVVDGRILAAETR